MEDQVAQPSGNNPLWAFADALYSSRGVEETCLHLQDQYGANVNLLLWCCWLESRGIELTSAGLERAKHAIEQWDADIVKPLRRARRLVKEGALLNNTTRLLKASIQEAELLAELHEQDLLFGVTETLNARDEEQIPGANLRLYLVSVGLRLHMEQVIDVFRSAMRKLESFL